MTPLDSPPSSPFSETLSLPETSSDLEHLSDFSDLSDDDDGKPRRVRFPSYQDASSDDDVQEVTHSMVASYTGDMKQDSRFKQTKSSCPVQSAASNTHSAVRAAPRNDGPDVTDKSSSRLPIRGASTASHSVQSLAFPSITTDAIGSPFGLDSFYQKLGREVELAKDPQLADFSILDAKGENLRDKYDKSIQTETDSIADATDSTVTLRPGPSSRSLPDVQVAECASSGIEEMLRFPQQALPAPSAEASSLAPVQLPHRHRRWLSKQTVGILGIALLGIATYQVRNGQVTTYYTGLAHSNNLSTIRYGPEIASTTLLATQVPSSRCGDPGNNERQPNELAQVTREVVKTDVPVAVIASLAGQTTTDRPEAVHKPSVRPSVSALHSFASTSLLTISNHVNSALAIYHHQDKVLRRKKHRQRRLAGKLLKGGSGQGAAASGASDGQSGLLLPAGSSKALTVLSPAQIESRHTNLARQHLRRSSLLPSVHIASRRRKARQLLRHIAPTASNVTQAAKLQSPRNATEMSVVKNKCVCAAGNSHISVGQEGMKEHLHPCSIESLLHAFHTIVIAVSNCLSPVHWMTDTLHLASGLLDRFYKESAEPLLEAAETSLRVAQHTLSYHQSTACGTLRSIDLGDLIITAPRWLSANVLSLANTYASLRSLIRSHLATSSRSLHDQVVLLPKDTREMAKRAKLLSKTVLKTAQHNSRKVLRQTPVVGRA